MNKQELIKEIASKCEMTRDDAWSVLNFITDVIKELVKDGNAVKIEGFGTFKPKILKASTGQCAGRVYDVPERQTVKFTASKTFKEMLNG